MKEVPSNEVPSKQVTEAINWLRTSEHILPKIMKDSYVLEKVLNNKQRVGVQVKRLNNDMWLIVLSFLSIKDISRFVRCCRQFREIMGIPVHGCIQLRVNPRDSLRRFRLETVELRAYNCRFGSFLAKKLIVNNCAFLFPLFPKNPEATVDVLEIDAPIYLRYPLDLSIVNPHNRARSVIVWLDRNFVCFTIHALENLFQHFSNITVHCNVLNLCINRTDAAKQPTQIPKKGELGDLARLIDNNTAGMKIVNLELYSVMGDSQDECLLRVSKISGRVTFTVKRMGMVEHKISKRFKEIAT